MLSTLSQTNRNTQSQHRHNYLSQKRRLLTYAAANPDLHAASFLLCSLAGFVLDDAEAGIHRCLWCGLKVKGFHKTHSPLAWHKTFSSQCSFLQNNKRCNLTDLDIPFLATTHFLTSNLLSSGAPLLSGEAARVDTTDNDQPQGASSSGEHNVTLQNLPPTDLLQSGDGRLTGGGTEAELRQHYLKNSLLRLLLPQKHIDAITQPVHKAQHVSELFFEKNRRKTFISWPKNDIVAGKDLAASGFVYAGTDDTVECVYCKVRLDRWTNEIAPNHRHAQQSPGCPLVQGLSTVTNIPDIVSDAFNEEEDPRSTAEISDELGIITDVVKYPDLAVLSRREATFLTWSRTHKKLASELIEHQLFYTGNGDTVCCFSCGVEMSNWTAIENIWVRHVKQSPRCQLLIREKGQEFINSTLEEHGRYIEPPKEPTINVVTTRMLRPRMDSLVAQAVLEMGYQREDVRSALIQNIKFGGPDFRFSKDLVEAILKKKRDQNELVQITSEIEEEIPLPQVVCWPQSETAEEVVEEEGEDVVSRAVDDELEEMSNMNVDESLNQASTSSSFLSGAAGFVAEADDQSLARELKSQMTCKVCLEAAVEIIFLPCGHFVCCTSCAPAMVNCPICRKEVTGTVRAVFDRL